MSSLALADCGVGDEGAAPLAAALRALPLLRSLSLSSNGIGPAGALALAAALGEGAAPAIEALDLQGNAVCGGTGTLALATALGSLRLLSALNLRKTGCGDPFVEALLGGATGSGGGGLRVLETLNLGANSLGEGSGRALVAWLSAPGAALLLVTLGLRDSGLGEAAEGAVAAVWPRGGAGAAGR